MFAAVIMLNVHYIFYYFNLNFEGNDVNSNIIENILNNSDNRGIWYCIVTCKNIDNG